MRQRMPGLFIANPARHSGSNHGLLFQVAGQSEKTMTDDGREYLAAVIEEIARRDRLRELVAQAGYVQDRANPPSWVSRAAITRAVATLTGDAPNSKGLGAELRQFLLAEGWRERRHGVHGDQWRARKVARVAAKRTEPG
jgi:hypothetical protein